MNSPSAPYKYFAFISYSRKDSRAAAWLQKRLEWFRFPVKLVPEERRPPHARYVRPIYRDKTNLEVTDEHYWMNIRQALEESRYLIVLCSPNSAASEPVDMEVTHFLETHGGDASIVVPVIVSGNVTSTGSDAALCPALCALGDALLGRNLPTMVSDAATAEQDAWEQGFVSLISYLLQLERTAIGDHIQRETKRQARVLRRWLGAVVVSALCAIAGFGFALMQRKEAVDQRNSANTQRRLAETETTRAEQNALRLKQEKDERDRLLLTQSRSAHAAALRLLSRGSYGEALAHYEQALTLSPQNANALLGSTLAMFAQDSPNWATADVLELEGESQNVSFSADGRRCAISTEKELKVYDTSAWQTVLTTKISLRTSCQITPDGSQCVIAEGYDSPLELIDVASGVSRPASPAFRGRTAPRVISISPDGQSIACGFWDGTASIVSLMDGSERKLPCKFERNVTCIAFSPDGAFVALSATNTLLMLNSASGEEVLRATCDGLISALCFSPDCQTLLTGCRGGEFQQFSVPNRAATGSNKFLQDITGMAFSPDLTWVGLGCVDEDKHGRLVLLPTAGDNGTEVLFQTPIRSLCFSPDGKWLVAASKDHARVLQPAPPMESAAQAFYASQTSMTSKEVLRLGYPDESHVSVSLLSIDGTSKVWEKVFDTPSTNYAPLLAFAKGILAVHRQGRLDLIRVADDRLLHSLPLKTDVRSMTFSPDGAWIVLGCADSKDLSNGQILAYETGSGNKVWEQPGTALEIAISPDSLKVALASIAGAVQVVELRSGKMVMEKTMALSANQLSFSPDGKSLAVGMSELVGSKGAAAVLEVATGKEIFFTLFPATTAAAVLHSDPLVLSASYKTQLFGPSVLVIIDPFTGERISSKAYPGKMGLQRESAATGETWISIGHILVRDGDTRHSDSRWCDRPGESAALWWNDLLRSRSGLTLTQGTVQPLSGKSLSQALSALRTASSQPSGAAGGSSWQTSILRWWLSPAEKRTTSPWSREPHLNTLSHQFQALAPSPTFLRGLCLKAPWHPLEPLTLARLEPKQKDDATAEARGAMQLRLKYFASLTLKRFREADEKLYGRDALAKSAEWSARILHEELDLDAEAKEALAFALERAPKEKQQEMLKLKVEMEKQ